MRLKLFVGDRCLKTEDLGRGVKYCDGKELWLPLFIQLSTTKKWKWEEEEEESTCLCSKQLVSYSLRNARQNSFTGQWEGDDNDGKHTKMMKSDVEIKFWVEVKKKEQREEIS